MSFKQIKSTDLSRQPLRTYQRQKPKTPDSAVLKRNDNELNTFLSAPLKRNYDQIFDIEHQYQSFSSPIKSSILTHKNHLSKYKLLKKSHSLKKKTFTTKPKFTQLYLDLLPSRITCPDCGMSYTRGSADDESIHIKFHSESIEGINYPLANSIKEVWRENFTSNKIIMITMSSPSREIKKAKEILSVVDLELGSASLFPNSMVQHNSRIKQYKFFLYLKGKKCIGLILVEPIKEAYPVHLSSSQSSSITLESEALSTYIMGVSRIWVCKTYRREKIATLLLNTACSHFIYGITVKKHEVAFSQPSESGKLFIESWAGKKFSVYVEK